MVLFQALLFLKPFIYERIFINAHHFWHALLLIYLFWFVIKKGYRLAIDSLFQNILLLFGLCTLLSFIYAIVKLHNQYFDSQHLYAICAGIFLSMLSFYEGKLASTLTKTVVASSVGICLVALYTLFLGTPSTIAYFRLHHLQYPFTEEFLNRRRAFFPFVSPDILGGFLILCFFLYLPFITRRKSSFLVIALIGITLILTKSIGIYFSVLAGLSIYLYAHHEKYSKKKALSILLGSLLVLSIFFIARQISEDRHHTPLFSLHRRANYIIKGIRMIVQHPFSGWGLGQFYPVSGTKYAHNLWVQLWAETGLPVLLVFCTFVGLTFKRGWQNIRQSLQPHEKKFHAALFSAHTAFIIHNCVDFDFFIFQASFLWWVLVGWIHYFYFNRVARSPA